MKEQAKQIFEIRTEINIKSDKQTIWNILTDFETYPNWNPFIKNINGDRFKGGKLKVKIQPPESSAMQFAPQILAFEEGRTFRWLGHFLFKGLFDGEHIFEIEEQADGTCLFVQREEFGGWLVPLFKKSLNEKTARGFRAMNEKLKELAEKSAGRQGV